MNGLSYNHNLDAIANGRKRLSDLRVARALKPATPDDAFDLLSVRDEVSGAVFTLRLCGMLDIQDMEGERYRADVLSDQALEQLEESLGFHTVLHNPWFEWIEEPGDGYVSEPFDSINADPDKEVKVLEVVLTTLRKRPVRFVPVSTHN